MSDAEWEDIAVGPSSSATGALSNNSDWEDVAGASAAPTDNTPWWGSTASGFLGGLSGFGDLIDLGQRYLTPHGALVQDLNPDARVGKLMRSGFDAATGMKGSTELGKGTYARKVGEYLPSMLMGGSLPKVILPTLASAAGGQIGEHFGGPVGEMIGAGVTGLGAQVAQDLVSSKVANELGKGLQRQAVGARASDYFKKAKDVDYWDIDASGNIQTELKKSLDDAISTGVIGDRVDAPTMLSNLITKQKDLGDEIGQLIDYADSVGVNAQPKFERALKFIKEGRVPADDIPKYVNRLNELSSAIAQEGEGSLRYLQNQKLALKGLWKEGDSASNAFNRALYTDIQKEIERHVPAIKNMNKAYGKLTALEGIFQRGLAQSESKNPLIKAYEFLRTSGAKTITGPALLGSLIGGGAGGPAGAAIGAGLGVLTNPKAQMKLGSFLANQTPRITNTFAGTPGILAERTAAQLAQKKEETPPMIENPPTTPVTEERPAAELDVDALVKAVGGWETRGLKDPDSAVSPKGAGGLMQIMPATAKEVLSQLGEDPEAWNPKDRAMNERVGRRYLQNMLNQFGDHKLAIAAYNAGPGAVEKWIKKFGTRDWDTIAKRLKDKNAYLETVNYVPGVLKRYEALFA